jgi:biopolymer transport protein ExbB
MSGFTLREMMLQGWPVLSVLLIMSILSVTIIVDRVMAFRAARLKARAFIANVSRHLDMQGVNGALDYCGQYRQPISMVATAILSQSGKRNARERALQQAVQRQVCDLELYVPVLGTIASTAPFIGLLGTVIGIIKAFGNIAVNVGGGPEVVAGGIAEALITTACGLLVAIPALMGYNYCVHRVQKLAEEMDMAAYDLIEKLSVGEE